MKLAALLVAAVLAFAVLWLAGEQRRENCQRSGHMSCSALPWDNGKSVTLTPVEPVQPRCEGGLNCLRRNAARRRDGVPESQLPAC
jgi:hypothetical protein